MSIKDRGFASMSPSKVREIAASGGRSAQKKGTAHRFTTETGRAAAKKRKKFGKKVK